MSTLQPETIDWMQSLPTSELKLVLSKLSSEKQAEALSALKAQPTQATQEYKYVGSGKDAAFLSRAIQQGWSISSETRQRLAKRIEDQARKADLTLKDMDKIATLIQRCDKASQEAIKLDMFAKLNGLETEAVQKTNSVKPEEKLVEAMLESCNTPEQARWLLNVARSIAY